MNTLQLLSALEMGLIYALIAFGVYITFRVIDFPDLTVDGSFTLGGGLSAILILSGVDPTLSTSCAVLAGAIAGIVTGILHTRWHILGLLAGILTMTGLYSINLRIMGKPNLAIMGDPTLFTDGSTLMVLAVAVLVTGGLLLVFFATQLGLAIRAVGCNPNACASFGISVGRMKIIALALSNAIVALGGALFAQSQGFADISMGTGTVIMGLAAVIIGEAFLRTKKIITALLACLIGSVFYRITLVWALNANDLGLAPSDLNLITALIVAGTMILPKVWPQVRRDHD